MPMRYDSNLRSAPSSFTRSTIGEANWMKRATGIPSKLRAERITALVAFALLAILAVFQLSDARLAFDDFETWWTRFEASYPGNDFVEVTYTAERVDGYNDHYRAIALAMAVKRTAKSDDATVRIPENLYELWGESTEASTTWKEPGLSEDYLTDLSTAVEFVTYDEDPRANDETIIALENAVTMNRLSWNVAYLTTGEAEDDITIVTDTNREWIYVLPTRLLEGAR